MTDLANPAQFSDSAGADYVGRINRAIDFVVQNLEEPIRLEDVARVACFSQFHFHRVFRALLGETLNQFVKRLRLERALYLMSHVPDRSLTQVALASGFSSSSDFSRSFKARYGVPPSAFDVETYRKDKREELQDAVGSPETRHLLDPLPPGENPDGFRVEIRELPPRTVAYMRVLNPYQGTGVVDAAERLVAWAEERGLADGQWLGYMWEDPDLVAHEQCRYDVAVEVEDVARAGEVGRFEFPSLLVAQLEIRGAIDLEVRALDWLFGTWLPSSRYIPADQPCFEAWIGRPFAHGNEHFELHVQLPIQRG